MNSQIVLPTPDEKRFVTSFSVRLQFLGVRRGARRTKNFDHSPLRWFVAIADGARCSN